jgi:uncharacterized protein DUF4199
MKKTVLTFGVLSGLVSAAMMLLTLPFIHRIGFDRGAVVGYTAIVASFILVFFGIRSYREQSGGSITFTRAFTVGILITLISCVFYVVTWEMIYFTMLPNFADEWTAYAIEKVRASGGSQAQIEAKMREMADLKKMLDNPLINAAFTFIEPFPIGLLMTLIASATLRRKPKSSIART